MDDSRVVDIGRIIDERRIGRFHAGILLWSLLAMLADGYDYAAVSYAAPSLIKEWGINRAAMGPVFGAGLFAGLFGALILGYVSDRLGRRKSIISGLLIFGVFTFITIWATSLRELIILRFLAGFGMGGAIPGIVALNLEYAPRTLRATIVAIMFAGVTLGGALPLPVSIWLLPAFGWQALFFVGGVIPIAVAVCMYFALPESLKFLLVRAGRRDDVMRLLSRIAPELKFSSEAKFQIRGEERAKPLAPWQLFRGRLAIITPLLWLIFLLNTMVFFFVNSWTPTLLSSNGFPAAHAALALALFQIGGTVGGLTFGRPLDKFGLAPVAIAFAVAIPLTASVGLSGLPELLLMVLIFAVGLCLFGCQAAINAALAIVYPTFIRSLGVGWGLSVSRLGAVAGPVIGGILIGLSLSLQQLFMVLAIPVLVCTVATFILRRPYKEHLSKMASNTTYTTGVLT